ncbi:MAG TPA: PIN domain-containing protein [Xanthomonadales bacterium]|nr:PIN domain-containing protein [Xanthomonadales bacterium]
MLEDTSNALSRQSLPAWVAACLREDVRLPDVEHGLQYRLPLADSIIYATARRYDATLWTQDADFRELPGVRFYS